jgi:asparagine synthase (glutamine-hydrolysing)
MRKDAVALQAGAVFLDDTPIDDEQRLLGTTLEWVSSHGVSTYAAGHVVMAYAGCSAWAGERSCAQPLQSPAGLVITWDGRLDNRNDLLCLLRAESCTHDAAIALGAFERWGTDGLQRLIGDWSLVIWEARERTLHLARDYMGVRPLFYCREQRSVRWSSSLGELAARTGRTDALDEVFVARYMALRPSTDVTPYEGIRAVPTAHCVSIADTGVETRQRFWCLQPGVVRYRNREQYDEHLRTLWREAVGTRLRVDGSVWSELSGGLDSSSVVCMAGSLIETGQVAAGDVKPLSHVAVQSPEADERRFISIVESQLGVTSAVLGVEEHDALRDETWCWITPLAPEGVQLAAIRLVCQHGGRVLLSGRMGDLVMGCTPDNSIAVCDDLASGHLLRALAKLRLWSRASRKPFLELAGNIAAQAIGTRSPVPRRPRNDARRASLTLLTERLQRLVDDRSGEPWPADTIPLSQRARAIGVLGYSVEARLETPCETGIVYAYPFAHRPLVEYLLSVPAEELSAPGEPRALMRRAFEGLVPARILQRFSKGHYSPAVLRSVRPVAARLLPADRLEVVRRGWICGRRLDAAARSLLDGGGSLGEPVQHVLRLEQWLTSRHRRAPAAIQKRKEVKTNDVLLA